MIKKHYKLIIFLLIVLLIFFIYKTNHNHYFNYTSLGDGYALGINSYGEIDYGYSDFIKDKLKKEKKLAVLHQKLKNARRHFIHQITKKLVMENDIIVTESLKLKDMIEEKRLSKQLTSVSLGELCRVLEYKSKIYGKKYIKIDSYYPSSQECSRCGYKNEKVKDLSVRSWICPECGSYHDRDYNASYNIMFEGLKKYMMELK